MVSDAHKISLQVSYIKSIDMYVMGCVLFVACAFIEYAIVLLLQHKKDTKLRCRNAKREMKVSAQLSSVVKFLIQISIFSLGI